VLLTCALIVDSVLSSPNSISADSSSMQNRSMLLDEAERILSTMKSSSYQHVTHVDETNGVYDFDCSGFLDYALQRTLPEALAVIKYTPNPFNRPRAQDYYYHFTKRGSGDNGDAWRSVPQPSNLLPGDVITWLKSPNSDSDDTGHVIIVRSNPKPDPDRVNEILVTIIDSTRSPHALDSRVNGATGIGTGTISLAMNTTGSVVGFRWRDGESKVVEYTKIAFGQPIPNEAYTANNPSRSAVTQLSSWSRRTTEPTIDALVLPAALILVLACVVIGIIQITKKRNSQQGMVVLDAANEIRDKQDSSLVYRRSCCG